jgi:hypothetical protein
MAWKVEKWLDEIFPGEDKIYDEYRELRPRELVIVSVAALDSALAQLITLRVKNIPGEYESFLGLNEDGRAPVASFGSRIQLALLLGIITEKDASVLRALKQLRNLFAHRVHVNFVSPRIHKPLNELYKAWVEIIDEIIPSRALHPEVPTKKFKLIGNYIGKTPQAGEGLVLAVFGVYQAYFHRLSDKIRRIDKTL